ncbi:MAG TPA: MG2 domain-containing protein [Thermoanaerobaculia bacterium]|nr:MG2 domain-containing protein [Thermoanaerobaculia bacterium]
MQSRFRFAVALAAILTAAFPAGAADPLRIVKAGPAGEVASLAEANEIRVVFSEPMVVIGRIPDPVTAPFFRITPAIPGTFRWSGTTTLIFTPDPKRPLPHATRYEVTIDPSATSIAGRRLEAPYSVSFTTPTVKLLRTEWYRKGLRFDDPLVILLRFNQPVDAKTMAEALSLRAVKHALREPVIPPAGVAWLQKNDPSSLAVFRARLEGARAAARSEARILGFFTDEWNKKRHPPSSDLLVFETQPGVPPDTWIRVEIGANARGIEGAATPAKPQEFTIQLERTFFVEGFRCSTACDPDRYNPLGFTSRVKVADVRKRISVTDITGGSETPAKTSPSKADEPGESEWDLSSGITFEDLGLSHQPAKSYRVRVDKETQSIDGQTLGYTWVGNLENQHRRAFSSFGEGHGVWESTGGAVLPFYARNLASVDQTMSGLAKPDLMPTILRLEEGGFRQAPDVPWTRRRLSVVHDEIQSHGLDVASLLSPHGTGLLWASLRDGQAIPRAHQDPERPIRSTLVQVTNLGITVKDSPLNTLVFVTRLDDGRPVGGAKVSIITRDNKIFWEGVTRSDGVAIAPNTRLRLEQRTEEELENQEWGDWYDVWPLRFIVTAEKEGDVAYVGSNWNEGLYPWEFGHNFDLFESKPLLRGTVFTDRGVYKPGEEIHFKAIIRSDTPTGMRLLPAATKADIVLKDSRDKEIDRRTVALNEWSSAEWVFTLPAEGSLGGHAIQATIDGQRGVVGGSFLVAAYRRPDFRVDASLTGDERIAGAKLKGGIEAKYLFGGAMGGRPVKWTYSKEPFFSVPEAIHERFPLARYLFLGWDPDGRQNRSRQTIESREAILDSAGRFSVDLQTDVRAGIPLRYTFEGEIEDVSRQKIAGRASLVIHPAPWYIGIKSPSYFVDTARGVDTEVVAVTPEGLVTPDVPVDVTLTRVQWHSVRRAEGNGFYRWETQRRETEGGKWNVVTGGTPVPLHIDVTDGGYYILRARASDGEGRSTTTITSFYALGPGYTAWERHDHNRIDLVPERTTYKPGETARIMIQSPWEKATALLTTEREGIRTHRQFELTSTQQTVTVPVTEAEIPNFYVSVVLVKGRTNAPTDDDTSDPGKPAFRLGYTQLTVEDATKRLDVAVTANREEYRPGSKARVEVRAKDHAGRAARAEVTLWAVDYGVLSLTAYQTPDVIESIYIPKAIQVLNEDSRQKIISRRVITPKGADEGGGGGVDAGPGSLRKDFRVLAFWLGSVTTDRRGVARADVTLPESLTTYRIMAVANDRENRFGWAQREIRTSKPVLLRPAFPRFLALGDKVHFGSVVQSQLPRGGTATVTLRSLDPALLTIAGESTKSVEVGAGGGVEVRFDAEAKGVGEARVQMSVRLLGESDAFEDVIPIRVLSSPETVAGYGEARPEARERIQIPTGVVPSLGGLHVELASTAMVGLGEGARYLIEYPYGCAEQRASRGLALVLAGDLGEAFRLPGIDPVNVREVAQANLRELEKFQCPDGGFTYWPGQCMISSPYLTSYIVHVFQVARKHRYEVDSTVVESALGYLEGELATPPPVNEGWWPSYTAWQTFAVKVLVEGGRNQDSNITRLYGYLDRMPVFALSYLFDAMAARGEGAARPAEIRRRIGNAILPEGGTAHVEELSDPYLLWFWNSNVRSTAIVLRSLVANTDDPAFVRGMVRWLMQARTKGRWGNTQENALAMEALIDYYRKYESEVPDFTAAVTLGEEQIASAKFQGRSTEAKTSDVPMPQLLRKGADGEAMDLVFRREGTGTLFYMTRLRYAVDQLFQTGFDHGFQVERSYVQAEGGAVTKTFNAGDLVRVELRFRLPKERRWVAVTDPIPAGFEPVESWFATTASELTRMQVDEETQGGDWMAWWQRGGFDHVERHDDRVLLFATRLSEGLHHFSYVVRATTAGTFRTAPTHVEEMYEPEVFGRGATDVVEVK